MKALNSINTIKPKWMLCALLVLCPMAGRSQTADDYVSQGRAFLAAHDLTNANARFAAALAVDPNHPNANVFHAATRLLTLASQPAGAALLDRLGIAATGRDVYDWTALPPLDAHGVPDAPNNMSAAELTAFLRTNILTEIIGAAANLAKVTDTNYELTLTSNETATVSVTLDYGDLLLIRSGLQFAQYADYTMASWNVDAQLSTLRSAFTNPATTAQGFLKQFPNLFTFGTTNDLAAARRAFTNAVALYLSASEFIRNRPANVVRLFNYNPEKAGSEANFRTTLTELNQSLNGPVVLTINTNLTVCLANHFAGTRPPRSFLPQFWGNAIIAGTLPDSTLGGLVRGLPAYQMEEMLGRHFPFVSRFTQPSRPSDTGLRLTLDALNNSVFLIQVSSNLEAWADLGLGLAQAGIVTVTDTNSASVRRRFYRAIELPEALSVAGNVIDVSTGGPLSNAMVVLSFPYDPSMESITNFTDAAGQCVLISRWAPPSREFVVTISCPGYSTLQYHGYCWGSRHVSGAACIAPAGYRPPNDDFAQRITLTGTNVSTVGFNVSATSEPGERDLADVYRGHSVWWTWTAPADGAVSIDTSGSSFDTVLGVYTGNSVSNLVAVASPNWDGRIEFFVRAGTTYQIAVDGDDTGRVVLNLRMVPPRPPRIIWQWGSQTARVGDWADFDVEADGTEPLFFQWRKDDQPIDGATNSWCQINDVQTSQAGKYFVVVSNAVGVVTSTPVILTVLPAAALQQTCWQAAGIGDGLSDCRTPRRYRGRFTRMRFTSSIQRSPLYGFATPAAALRALAKALTACPGWTRPRHGSLGRGAVFRVSARDDTAAVLLRSMESQGVRVPRDVRVVGFDDVKYATLVSVPLTTIHQPCRDIAVIAFRTMMERLAEPTLPPRGITLTSHLVVRESCGAYLPRVKATGPVSGKNPA